MEENNPKNIIQKLFEIQMSIKTFAAKEDAEKRNASGKSEYKYTPGWEIIERVRTEMDSRGLMLSSNFVSHESKEIEYPVYKIISGKPMSFLKKEMYVEVKMEYTWVDTVTGEKDGPYTFIGFGANGTDKSGATALSMAKRYFLLNFFNITTHEDNEEIDAHDSGNIPGIPNSAQPYNATPQDATHAVPVGGSPVQHQPTCTSHSNGNPAYTPTPGGYQGYHPAGGNYPQVQGTSMPAQGQLKGFNPTDPGIQTVITALANFEKGTNSHKKTLNEYLARLTASGYDSTNPNFVIALVDMAQAKREGN